MPYVNVKLTKGPELTRARKSELVASITGLLVELLGKRSEHVHIVIDEVGEEDWGFAGVLTDEYRARQGREG